MKDKLEKKILKKMRSKKKNFDKLSEKEKYKFNAIRQKLKGKKKYDYFEITEPGHSKDIFKFDNLKEWDFLNYEFQKKHGTLLRDTYDTLYMPGDWFRALELDSFGKRNLTYGQLESARSYILSSVIDKLQEVIDSIYPVIYIIPYGEKTFKPTKDKKAYTMTELETRSCGNEKVRDALMTKLISLTEKIEEDIIKRLKPYEGYTFRKYSEGPRHKMLDIFIIGGFEAAENISFKTFFKDFVERQQPVEYLDKIIDRIFKNYKRELVSPRKEKKIK